MTPDTDGACQLHQIGVKLDPAKPTVLMIAGDDPTAPTFCLCPGCARKLALTLLDAARDAEMFVTIRDDILSAIGESSREEADSTAEGMVASLQDRFPAGGGVRLGKRGLLRNIGAAVADAVAGAAEQMGFKVGNVVVVKNGRVVIDDDDEQPETKVTPSA